MKRLVICLLFSTILLAGCVSKNEVETKDTSKKVNQEIAENINDGNKDSNDESINKNIENEEESTDNNKQAGSEEPVVIEDSSAKKQEGVKGQVQLYEGNYFDDRCYLVENRPEVYCEVQISNITETSFDFTVYQVEYKDMKNSTEKERKVIILTNTAVFIGDGTKAAFYGHDYTLNFTFPDNHSAYPVVTDMEITGFEPLEGHVYVNNSIPGHEFG